MIAEVQIDSMKLVNVAVIVFMGPILLLAVVAVFKFFSERRNKT